MYICPVAECNLAVSKDFELICKSNSTIKWTKSNGGRYYYNVSHKLIFARPSKRNGFHDSRAYYKLLTDIAKRRWIKAAHEMGHGIKKVIMIFK